MTKSLVAYFSASGVTAALAKRLASAIDADLFEIQPETPYRKADLDWSNPKCRSTIEMNDKASRPAVANKVENMAQYDTVYVGFPIWWYVAPTVINTFLEQYDLTGKTLIPFATSDTSGMGNTNTALAPSCRGAVLKDGKRFGRNASKAALKAWTDKVLSD